MNDFKEAYLLEKAAREKAELLLAEKSQLLSALHLELEEKTASLYDQKNLFIQAEKMATLGTLCAGVAHEINNPLGYSLSNLASLKSYTENLLAVVALAESFHHEQISPNDFKQQIAELDKAQSLSFLISDLPELLKDNEYGLNKISQIVTNLLEFSHGKEQKKQFANVIEAINSALKLLNSQLQQCDIQCCFSDLPLTWCNLANLTQVFVNIIVNAKHACEHVPLRDNQILINAYLFNDEIVVDIEDNGCGMSKQQQEKMFDPFFTTKEVGVGTGMGMTLVYGLISDHNGRIEVQSNENVGTRISCYLPVLSQVPSTNNPLD